MYFPVFAEFSIFGPPGKAMPKLGEHTTEILYKLGYNEVQIASLRKNRITYP
jgi:crotonobetainyl-CoA:carnitine CoA-transferase CaiB-like acyl-CoA transferase